MQNLCKNTKYAWVYCKILFLWHRVEMLFLFIFLLCPVLYTSQKSEYLKFLNCALLWKAIRCFQSRLSFDENELKEWDHEIERSVGQSWRSCVCFEKYKTPANSAFSSDPWPQKIRFRIWMKQAISFGIRTILSFFYDRFYFLRILIIELVNWTTYVYLSLYLQLISKQLFIPWRIYLRIYSSWTLIVIWYWSFFKKYEVTRSFIRLTYPYPKSPKNYEYEIT